MYLLILIKDILRLFYINVIHAEEQLICNIKFLLENYHSFFTIQSTCDQHEKLQGTGNWLQLK